MPEALILGILAAWLQQGVKEVDVYERNNCLWITRTISQFQAACPYFSAYQVRSALQRLEADDLIAIDRLAGKDRPKRQVASYSLTSKSRLLLEEEIP